MKSNVALRLPILAVLGALVIPAAAQADRVLTLDDAIGLALERNEEIVVSRESAGAAEAAVSGAKGVYNPFLTVSGGWERAKEPVNSAFSGAPGDAGAPTTKDLAGEAAVSQYLPSGGTLSVSATTRRGTTDGTFDLLSPVYQSRVGVELRQPLLRDLAIDQERLSIHVAGEDRRRTAAGLRITITETVAAVERAYWNLVAARAAVDVRVDAVGLAERQLAETEERMARGAAPETEAAQPRAQVEHRRGELLTAREAVTNAETALKLLILGDADADLWQETLVPEVDAPVETVPVDRGSAMARALEQRPELEAAAALIDRRQAEHRFARNRTLPSVDAVVSYDRFGMTGSPNEAASNLGGIPPVIPDTYDGDWGTSWSRIGNGDFDDLFAGLVLSYPIGNDAAQGGEAVARHVLRQAEAGLTRVRKRIRAEVLDAAAALETAGQRMEAARAQREAAEIQLGAEEDRYEAGLSTNFLVLTRQNDLSDARLDEISARADYGIARTDLARATGELLERNHIDVEDTGR